MAGISKAETLYREYMSIDKSNRRRGTGRMPTEDWGGDIVKDKEKYKQFKYEQGVLAFMRLVHRAIDKKFRKLYVAESIKLDELIREIAEGKTPLAVAVDLGGELPLNVIFQIAPKPELIDGKFKELTDGETSNRTENTERISAGSKETS